MRQAGRTITGRQARTCFCGTPPKGYPRAAKKLNGAVMLVEVKVPQLSESVAEATLLSWHKKVGDAVARDENLIDVETDKVVLELPAPAGGVITRIVKGDGGSVVSGEVIAVIDTAADAAAAKAAEKPAAPVAQAAQQVSDQSKLMPAARKM